MVQDFTALPSTCTTQAPHCEVSQPTCVPVRPRVLAQEMDQQRSVFDSAADRSAVHHQRYFRHETSLGATLVVLSPVLPGRSGFRYSYTA